MKLNQIYRSGLMAMMSLSVVFAASAAPVAAQAAAPTFKEGKCQFTISADANQTEGKTYKCGTVAVPEDHSKPGGKMIEIAVAVFKSNAKKPEADPVIYLDGGPGGFSLASAQSNLTQFGAILDKRDLILFDQRGVGFSTPSLYCPEATKLDQDLLGVVTTPAELDKKGTDAMLACQKGLLGLGVDLSLYNTDQNAADVDWIQQALGYKMLNLYGISYGTNLGLVTLRDFGATIRSAVLDSNVPLETPMDVNQIPATERVFKQLWDGCKADPGCNQAYPNLEKVFYTTVDKLNKKPVTLTFTDNDGKNPRKVALNGFTMQESLFNVFYLTDYIPLLPEAIYQASKGKLDFFGSIHIAFTDEDSSFALGMNFSVNCRERLAFESMDQVTKAAAGNPQQLLDDQIPSLQSEFDICAAWGAGKAPESDKQPVKSSVPTLVMAGSYDPVTPPEYSQLVAKDLGNAQYVEIPNSGHGASVAGDCPFSLVTSFFDAPTEKLDTSCVDSIGPPQWKLPGS